MKKVMETNVTEPVTLAIAIKHGAIAFFGAAVHALNAHRRGESKTIIDFFSLVAISSFSGAMFAAVGLHIFGDGYVSFCIAGTGGFLGIEGMAYITKFVKTSINANFPK